MEELKAWIISVKEVLALVPWFTVAIISATLIALAALVRYQQDKDNDYNVWDMLTKDGRADLYKHVLVVCLVISLWVVVRMVQEGKNVETILLGILGIFVGARAINSVADTLSAKEPPKPEPEPEPEPTPPMKKRK